MFRQYLYLRHNNYYFLSIFDERNSRTTRVVCRAIVALQSSVACITEKYDCIEKYYNITYNARGASITFTTMHQVQVPALV